VKVAFSAAEWVLEDAAEAQITSGERHGRDNQFPLPDYAPQNPPELFFGPQSPKFLKLEARIPFSSFDFFVSHRSMSYFSALLQLVAPVDQESN